MFESIARTTCLAMLVGFCVATEEWTYNEEEWPSTCKHGAKQSPIDLSPDIAVEEDYSSLIFEGYEETYPVQIKNNGHTFQIHLQVENQPSVRGGGLPNVYILDQLHFHWESEHTMNELRFPLEMHLVHYANNFPNTSEALKVTGGVTVFAVMFYISPDDDYHFEPLTNVFDRIKDQINTVQELHLQLDDFLPRDKAGFYRYNGSLTTPACTEGVIWTVFTNKLPISAAQAKIFHSLMSEDVPLQRNYRSLQELNGRRVVLRRSPVYMGASNTIIFNKFLFALILFNIVRF